MAFNRTKGEKVLEPALEHRCDFCGESLRYGQTESLKTNGGNYNLHPRCKASIVGEENVRTYQASSLKQKLWKGLLLIAIISLAMYFMLHSYLGVDYINVKIESIIILVAPISILTILLNRILKI